MTRVLGTLKKSWSFPALQSAGSHWLITGTKEVHELGEYLLFISNQAVMMASPLMSHRSYGADGVAERREPLAHVVLVQAEDFVGQRVKVQRIQAPAETRTISSKPASFPASSISETPKSPAPRKAMSAGCWRPARRRSEPS